MRTLLGAALGAVLGFLLATVEVDFAPRRRSVRQRGMDFERGIVQAARRTA